MRHFKLTDNNKSYIIRRYCDFICSHMDPLEFMNEFKNYFYKEKYAYKNDILEDEINRVCPEILEDHTIESYVNKGAEYAKTI